MRDTLTWQIVAVFALYQIVSALGLLSCWQAAFAQKILSIIPERNAMSHYHAVVWIDHAEAHVMHISPDDVESSIVRPGKPHQHLHSKRGVVGVGRVPEDQHFYNEVVEALQGAEEILIVGPANAKLNLIKHIHHHDQPMSSKVVGVETVDHPTDRQLVAYARKYFTAADRLQS